MRLILVTVLVSVAVGLATGGSLRDFPGQRIRWGGVALAGVAAQFVVLRGSWAFGLLALSFVLLIAFAAANVRRPGFLLILLGLCLNAGVILANQGMPVTQAAIRASHQQDTLAYLREDHDGAKHLLAGEGTRLLVLGDVIAIGPPIRQAISVGDVLVHLGVAWFVIAAMRRHPAPAPAPERSVGAGGAP